MPTLREDDHSYTMVKSGLLISNLTGRVWKITLVQEGQLTVTVTTQEAVAKIYDINMTDTLVTERYIAIELSISLERVHTVIRNELKIGMQKVCSRCTIRKSCTITGAYYAVLLRQYRNNIPQNLRGMLTKKSTLYQYNASTHKSAVAILLSMNVNSN